MRRRSAMIDPLYLLLAPLLGAVIGVAVAGWWPRGKAPPVVLPPPDPFAQITQQVGAISTWLEVYQKQFQTLAERYERLEKDFRALEDRADQLEASNTTLSGKLIAAYTHIDYVYAALGDIANSPILVAGFRERDPRRQPPAAGGPH